MRKILLFGMVILTGISFIARLFYLQIYESATYDLNNDNAIRKVFQYPKRGYIYDRNDSLLVANQPSYDVMVIPREVEPLDNGKSKFTYHLRFDNKMTKEISPFKIPKFITKMFYGKRMKKYLKVLKSELEPKK